MDELAKKRHSLAHLLAAAVLEKYPDAKLTLGPDTDEGFYYDIDFGDVDFSEDDLSAIEAIMKNKLPTWESFEKIETNEAEARKRYEDNQYKLELIDGIAEAGEDITLYQSGDFVDLCRGGHVDNPSEDIDPDSFTLDSVAGAYWRGDEENEMLTRIYGLAFDTPEELEEFITNREEAKKRDHRKLGKELGLFTFSDLVGPGLPLFTPKGALMRNLITEKISELQTELGYEQVTIPHITKKDLYEQSGHWDKFGDELFKVKGQSDTEFVMKPMNCPHHTQIYSSELRSYRDLPVRYAENTMVYRDEQTGELSGLSRVRAITQDDGHVFCTLEQVEEEVLRIIKVIEGFYSSLNMYGKDDVWVSLSVRDPDTPEKYLGKNETWDTAEQMLADIAKDLPLRVERIEGEAAFYGPKLDFMFTDALGREWQLATAQLDFVMPERFGLEYVSQVGERETPVMIHRAIAGSLERFMSIIIEHFAGNFPLWLAPEQVRILPISDDEAEYAQNVKQQLETAGYRVSLDGSDDSLGKRIHNTKKAKVPYYLVIGSNEVEAKTVTLESRDDGKVGEISVEKLLEKLDKERG